MKIVSISRLLEYILRITQSQTKPIKDSSEVIIRYWDRDHLCDRRYVVTSLMMEQTEDGPLTLILGAQDR